MGVQVGDLTVIFEAQSKSATFTSNEMAIERFRLVAVQAVVTSASGDLNVTAQPEVSLDGVNWDAWSQPDVISPSNLVSSFNLGECAFSYFRMKFTFTAGSGTFKVYARGKL